jgi:hypothetical protein
MHFAIRRHHQHVALFKLAYERQRPKKRVPKSVIVWSKLILGAGLFGRQRGIFVLDGNAIVKDNVWQMSI